ncbi:MAG: hypothetical protein DRI57_16880 [Deltaproteobacteria bacterium]|nr:MAG: hypothetical protein DRI57_16880 [Deltaproteobacteria bacterium]
MQIVENIALISINETLFIQLISFLIFMVIMDRIMFRPLRKVMGDRDDYVQKIESEIADAEIELDNISTQLKAKSSVIKQEAFDLKEELEASGSQHATDMFEATLKDIEEIKRNAGKEIDAQIAEAKKYIKTESESLALNIMEKILDRRLVR